MPDVAPLDALATKHVGDGKEPNLFFVSDEEGVLAVFTEKEDALALAEECDAVRVEDRLEGVVWGEEYEDEEEEEESGEEEEDEEEEPE